MPLSYISLGRHLEGNIVIYDLHYDYLLILIFIWSSGFLNISHQPIQDLMMAYIFEPRSHCLFNSINTKL